MNEYVVDTDAIKIIMIKKKIKSQMELSRQSGINRNVLSNVLNNKKYPSSTVMNKLISALDIDQDTAGKIFFVQKLT